MRRKSTRSKRKSSTSSKPCAKNKRKPRPQVTDGSLHHTKSGADHVRLADRRAPAWLSGGIFAGLCWLVLRVGRNRAWPIPAGFLAGAAGPHLRRDEQ